jgi:hypothetical protein
MAIDRQVTAIPGRRLWFGFATSALAWVTLGCLDLVITWRACTFQEGYGIPAPRPDVRIAFAALALLLLCITIAAGVISYRNWRSLSTERHLLETNAVDRQEFMALVGVLVSVIMGMGIVWLALPPLFLDLCWRAR